MINIQLSKINNLEESLLAARLPMSTTMSFREMKDEFSLEDNLKLAKRLGRAKSGSGHDCFLKGVNVFMVITAPEYWWGQWERYAFQDTVSSTSLMHKVTEHKVDEILPFLPNEEIKQIEELQNDYRNMSKDDVNKDIVKQTLLESIPRGVLYTRAVTLNYLQLKTMYLQRRNHDLNEWQVFCDYVEAMPYFMELTGIEK